MLVPMLRTHGQPAPSAYRDATGALFVAANTPAFTVVRIAPGGTVTYITLPERIVGQGALCLQPDGSLLAVGGATYGTSEIVVCAVPSWQPLPRWSGGAVVSEVAVPLYEPDYLPEHLDTAPELTVRFNKLKEAVEQTRRALAALGALDLG